MNKSMEKTISNFDDMALKEPLLRAIFAYGFEKPSLIQRSAVPSMVSGKDIIAQAQSGTGKTAAFTISTLQRLNYDLKNMQAIFLSPTKELAEQTYNVVNKLGVFKDKSGDDTAIKTILAIGGRDRKKNIDDLKDGAQIMIGTPGRVLDLLTTMAKINESFHKNIRVFVLDEADEMLKRGFHDQIVGILSDDEKTGKPGLPNEMQVALFSATLPNEALDIAKRFMTDPITIVLKKEEVSLSGITNYYIPVKKEEYKYDTLKDILQSIAITKCIVFCNSKQKATWLHTGLTTPEEGDKAITNVGIIHSDMELDEREKAMNLFKSGAVNLLISTDLLARGIDVKGISLVINYDLPTNPENYMHRVGRSGRYGSKGMAINFVTDNDGKYIDDIKTAYKVVITEMPLVSDLKV